MANPYLSDPGIRMDIVEHLPYLESQAAQSQLVIEFGVEYGNGSTLALMNGLRQVQGDKLMISVDVDDRMTLERKPVESYWKFILGNSSCVRVYNEALVFVNEVWPGGKKADIIFIDSYHVLYQVKDEINLWISLSDNDTIWLFHDIWDNISDQELEFSLGIRAFALSNGYKYEVVSPLCNGLSKMSK